MNFSKDKVINLYQIYHAHTKPNYHYYIFVMDFPQLSAFQSPITHLPITSCRGETNKAVMACLPSWPIFVIIFIAFHLTHSAMPIPAAKP